MNFSLTLSLSLPPLSLFLFLSLTHSSPIERGAIDKERDIYYVSNGVPTVPSG